MAQTLDGAIGTLVQASRRIQTARSQVGFGDPGVSMIFLKLIECRSDDLIPEENDVVQLALKRLPPKEAYDRVFRLRRAFQVPFDPRISQQCRPY